MWIHPNSCSYPLLEIEQPFNPFSFFLDKSKDLKLFWIEFPKTLLIISFFSNFVIDASLMVNVDWDAVRFKQFCFFEISLPKPELEIIFTPSRKYSKDNGPDW